MLAQNRFKKHAIGAAVAALLANGAMAQSAAPEGGSGQIQEVMVTAQRISQPASKTPLALSVVSGDELKAIGAVNASSLTELMPNIQISNKSGATEITIRGVSSADNSEKGDPSASFNVDGVNLARPQSAGLAFFDLERVEVLRGPQGTLYGRNATAGAINLISNKPDAKFDSSAAIELGNYNSKKFDGMLNVPINETLAIRGAIASSKHDGYNYSTQKFSTNYDDDDSLSARVQAMFKFSPKLSLLLSIDASTLKGAGPGSVPYSTFRNNTGKAQRTSTPSVLGFVDNRSKGASAELKANTDVGELTYQLARRTMDRNEDQPIGEAVPGVPGTDFRVIADYAQLSHELRLASAFGPWKTIGGLYWFKETSSIDARLYNFPNLGVLAFIQSPTISESKAAFGEATYSVTPDFHLFAGVRQTKDDKSRKGSSQYGMPVFFRAANDAAVSYSQTTGRVGADYLLAKNTMLYASLSTGYKAGGFNDGTDQTNPFLRYDPEQLTALEVGLKGRFLNSRLQVNTSVFVYDYKDLQLTGFAIDPKTGAVNSQTLNAAKASVKGIEIEGKYAVTNTGKINFSATYLDAHFVDYMPKVNIDWTDKQLAKSPKTTVAIGYSHNWNLENGGTLTASVNSRYSASYVLNDYDNAAQHTQDSYHQSDVNASYSPASYKWTVQAYVRNLENNNIFTSYRAAASVFPAVAGMAPPRTMGVRLSANF